MPRQFTCHKCGGLFTTNESPEDLLKKATIDFGLKVREQDLISLCDSCYMECMVLLKSLTPEQRKELFKKAGY